MYAYIFVSALGSFEMGRHKLLLLLLILLLLMHPVHEKGLEKLRAEGSKQKGTQAR